MLLQLNDPGDHSRLCLHWSHNRNQDPFAPCRGDVIDIQSERTPTLSLDSRLRARQLLSQTPRTSPPTSQSQAFILMEPTLPRILAMSRGL